MTILTPANAFPNLPFPQHGTGGGETLDPTKSNTAGATLSGGNLIWTITNTGGLTYFALSADGHSSGKYYCEVTILSGTSNYDIGIGIAKNGTKYLDTGGIGDNGTDNAGWWPDANDTNFYQNGNTGTSLGINHSYHAGDVIGMAVDLTNQTIWYRVNGGSWNANSGSANNPTTNTGGISISPTLSGSPTVYACVCVTSFSCSAKINFGATAYQSAAPSGFSNWGAGPSPLSDPQSYTYPGAVWPKATGPAVLSWTNAFPNLAFPQHLSGQTNTVQNYLYPGAVQPMVSSSPPATTILPFVVEMGQGFRLLRVTAY